MTTRLLHMSDTHIGYKQYHLSEREHDFRNAFESIINDAIDKDVDGVVHAGDLFHRSRPSVRSLSFVIDNLKRLRDAGIGFYVIAGNHDGTNEQQWPSLFENIGLATYLDHDGDVVGDVALYGQDHVSPGKRDTISYTFNTDIDATYRVFVGHGLFQPFPHGEWDLERILAKSPVSFDACLLGDDHTHRVETVNNTIATYAGSTERTAADQRDARGFSIITFGNTIDIDHHTVNTREFVYVDVEMSDGDGTDAVRDALDDVTIPDDSVVIVTLTGGGERVPSAAIEQSAAVADALTVTVNDRREFADTDVEYEEVSFNDPDEAVRERKRDLELSSAGAELEALARDLEGVPDTHVKDAAEEQTEAALDEHGIDALSHRDADTDTDTETDTDGKHNTRSTQATLGDTQ